MYHLALCLLFVIGVDAIAPRSHYRHVSRRIHGDPHTLDVFPRSSHAMNSANPLVNPDSGSPGELQSRQVKRQVIDRDWAHASSVETSPNIPEHDVNYLSNTGPVPAGKPSRHVPVTESSAEAPPASASPLADPPSVASPSQAIKASHGGKGSQHRKGDIKHHAGRSKKMMKKTMRL